jgi:hypothetical protein
MLSYDGSPQAFYWHGLNANTGEFLYGNTIGGGGAGYSSCLDGTGCGVNPSNAQLKSDSLGRVYIVQPIGENFGNTDRRLVIRLNMDLEVSPGVTNFRIDETWPQNIFTRVGGSDSLAANITVYPYLFIVDDVEDIIVVRSSLLDGVINLHGEPMPRIVRLDTSGNKVGDFGYTSGNDIGIFDFQSFTLDEMTQINEDLFNVKGTFVFVKDGITLTRNIILMNSMGRVTDEYINFSVNFSESLGNRLINNGISTSFNTQNDFTGFYNPTIGKMILGKDEYDVLYGSNSYFRYRNEDTVLVDALQSYTFYTLITNQGNTDHSLGYQVDMSNQLTENSFVTVKYMNKTAGRALDYTLDDVVENGNITDKIIKHADGVDPEDSITVGQVDSLLEPINEDIDVLQSETDLLINTINTRTFGIDIDGSGFPISTGIKGYVVVPYDCEIISWFMISDTVGSIEIDIWKSNGIPTISDSICDGNTPKLTAQQSNTDTTLTGWDLTINESDIVAFNVISASTVTKVNLIIKIKLI